jgi:hypothetical protein
LKRCYICSRTLVFEGENQNVNYLDSEICLNCELTLENDHFPQKTGCSDCVEKPTCVLEPTLCDKNQLFWDAAKIIEREIKEAATKNHYTENSVVDKQKERIEKIVTAHWNYMEKVLSTGQDKTQTFTWDQIMEMRKWDYTSSAIHFYGHGYEDAKNESK